MTSRRIGLMIAVCLVCLCGCGKTCEPSEQTNPAKLHIVTTIYPPADFARQIGGDSVDVYQLLKPGAESHTYELTPRDVQRIQNCDLFIYTGGESDTWIEEILSSDMKNVNHLRMTDAVELLAEEVTEGMQVKGEEEEEEELDEHVWTSPRNAIAITEAIAVRMMELRPELADDFRENANCYEDRLQALHEAYSDTFSEEPQRTIIVADRFPFRYMAHEYQFRYDAAFPGCSEDAEVSARTLASLIHKTRQEGTQVVFHIEFSNEKIADSVCEVVGAKKLLLHSCHNLSQEQIDAGEDYISIMEQNLANLKEALH